jgi:hypothetical protein
MVHSFSVAVCVDESGLPLVADRDLHSGDVTRECTAGLIAGRATSGGDISTVGRGATVKRSTPRRSIAMVHVTRIPAATIPPCIHERTAPKRSKRRSRSRISDFQEILAENDRTPVPTSTPGHDVCEGV